MENKFSSKSLERLETCHEDLQKLFLEVIKHFDCSIICGHRNQEDQDEAFRTGKSKLKWPLGKHNSFLSLAVDVAPCLNGKVDWSDHNYFKFFAGFVLGVASQMKIKVRWGGDFNSDFNLKNDKFLDMPHFELVIEGDVDANIE